METYNDNVIQRGAERYGHTQRYAQRDGGGTTRDMETTLKTERDTDIRNDTENYTHTRTMIYREIPGDAEVHKDTQGENTHMQRHTYTSRYLQRHPETCLYRGILGIHIGSHISLHICVQRGKRRCRRRTRQIGRPTGRRNDIWRGRRRGIQRCIYNAADSNATHDKHIQRETNNDI